MTGRIPVAEVLRRLGIEDADVLVSLRSEGLFQADLLEESEAEELRVATCLMLDLGVNPAGVEVALQLRRRLLVLQQRTEVSLKRLLDEEPEDPSR